MCNLLGNRMLCKIDAANEFGNCCERIPGTLCIGDLGSFVRIGMGHRLAGSMYVAYGRKTLGRDPSLHACQREDF